jgi:hypothetical protein
VGPMSQNGRGLPATFLQFAAVIVLAALASMHSPAIPHGKTHNPAHPSITAPHQNGSACVATYEDWTDVAISSRSATRSTKAISPSVRCYTFTEYPATPDRTVLSIWRL